MTQANRNELQKKANNLKELCAPASVRLLDNGIQAMYKGHKLMFYYGKMVYHDNEANEYRKFQKGKEYDIIKLYLNLPDPKPATETQVTNIDGVQMCIDLVVKRAEVAIKNKADLKIINLLRQLAIEFEEFKIV